ncbi:Uncharacterized protein HZ326_4559 [Fusarium oxysporum f. sp. albedinis]|nr:Uncharacterized protein HZ326_4559 [Fusarium oxysporum f. sp. albedinis]
MLPSGFAPFSLTLITYKYPGHKRKGYPELLKSVVNRCTQSLIGLIACCEKFKASPLEQINVRNRGCGVLCRQKANAEQEMGSIMRTLDGLEVWRSAIENPYKRRSVGRPQPDCDMGWARLPDNIMLLKYDPIGILTLLEETETYDRLASSGISRRGIRCTTISVKGWAIELGYFDSLVAALEISSTSYTLPQSLDYHQPRVGYLLHICTMFSPPGLPDTVPL